MIYLQGDGIKIVILETANLEKIKAGRPAVTPDQSVMICWTPDPGWLSEQLKKCDGDAVEIGKLIDAARSRPENPTPPGFTHQKVDLKGGRG